VLDTGFVAEAVAMAADRIVIAVDVRDDNVMVRGWQEAGPRVTDAVPALTDAGVARFLITSIDRDGTMDGPDLDLYRRVMELTDRPIIASGGVRKAEDVHALRDLGLEAAVVGKALYSGTLRLEEVVRG
jgi:phosphoribosylformimino-5-aminoimidazole carboxamide ribonucleotide (ProFAR) isomerase